MFIPKAGAGNPVHLAPRTDPDRRSWIIGDLQRTDLPIGCFVLCTGECSQASFHTLRSMLEQLTAFAKPEHMRGLEAINGILSKIGLGGETPEIGAADYVSLAVTRRISRESEHTARLIDLSARVINEILDSIPTCRFAYVGDLDRRDRPSIKVLARAMVLHRPEHRFDWMFGSRDDPAAAAPSSPSLFDRYAPSRTALLRSVIAVAKPRLRAAPGGVRPSEAGTAAKGGVRDACQALVLQNYDLCFLICRSALEGRRGGPEAAQFYRFLALAAVNVGDLETAITALCRGLDEAATVIDQVVILYLLGLIEAKRSYDLGASDDRYQRALTLLETSPARPEVALERAWLYNGLALNHVIGWRRGSGPSALASAFTLLGLAFREVASGDDAARTYLRFNLMANTAFLLEMRGAFDDAIAMFERGFAVVEGGSEGGPVDSGALNYRIAVLHLRAGRPAEAERLLSERVGADASAEAWMDRQVSLLALGCARDELGDRRGAELCFRQGLDLCRDARAARGFASHATALCWMMARSGRSDGRREIDAALDEEGLPKPVLPGQDRRAVDALKVPSKIPAYIPEIDLEDVPTISINEVLSGQADPAKLATAWRS